MIFYLYSRNQIISFQNTHCMANTGKTVATLLIGAAIGAAAGYVLATDKDSRQETLDSLKEKMSSLQDSIKERFKKKSHDLEEEIYNA